MMMIVIYLQYKPVTVDASPKNPRQVAALTTDAVVLCNDNAVAYNYIYNFYFSFQGDQRESST
jgi:hypothetical protein